MATSSVAAMEDQATSSLTRYPTQLHYPDIKLTSPGLILIMLSVGLGNKHGFHKSLVLVHWKLNSRISAQAACALSIRPPHPVRTTLDNSHRVSGQVVLARSVPTNCVVMLGLDILNEVVQTWWRHCVSAPSFEHRYLPFLL